MNQLILSLAILIITIAAGFILGYMTCWIRYVKKCPNCKQEEVIDYIEFEE